MNQHYKKDHFEILILLFVFSFFTKPSLSAQYLYESDNPNILLIREKGDWNSSFSFLRDRTFEKGNTGFQSGYSPFNNLVFTSNFFHTKNKRWDFKTGEDFRKGFSTGLAFGYYYFFENFNKEGGLLFDSFLGYSLGNYSFDFSQAGNGKITYHKYYLQIGIHKIMNRLRFSFVTRLGRLNMRKIELFGRTPLEDFNQIKSLANQKLYKLQEFSVRLSYRIKMYSIFVNVNTFPRIKEFSTFEQPPINYNIGIHFSIKT